MNSNSWRDGIKVHPAADLFPMMADVELDELAADIAKNGVLHPIVWLKDELLDGRSRVAAVARIADESRREQICKEWREGKNCIIHPFHADPFGYVVSANVHRRHLTAEQKHDVIAALLKAHPEQSDRAIAKTAKVNDKTVTAARREAEASAEIPHIAPTERVGADGKKSRARKTLPRTPSGPRVPAHEITQPLAGILMLARAGLRRASGSADALKQSLEAIAEAATRAMGIVQHLRSFIKNNQLDRHIQQIPEVVEAAVGLASLGDVSNLVVSTRYHPAAKTAFCDRVQIEQVIFNLVRNAIEAMPGSTGCVLTVASEPKSEGLIQISIADNGAGLPSTIRAKLFEPFFTTKASGLGVGLSICQVIIEAHGGQLWAEDNPGGGTIFRFTLPQQPADITEEEKQLQA